MVPFFFGAGQRRLFGAYDPAQGVNGTVRGGVVICYPCGSEYLFAHRSLRQLASRLSQNGFETLRFDYFGTGNSAGNIADADFAGWQDDIECAIEELFDLTGLRSVVLVGLRLGANLAASVARKRSKDVNSVVMWDPIVSGENYLRQICLDRPRNFHLFRLQRAMSSQTSEKSEIGGVPVATSLAREFAKVDLTNGLAYISANSLIILSARLPWYAALENTARQVPENHFKLEFIEDIPAWLDRPGHTATVPVNVIRRTVEWMVHCK